MVASEEEQGAASVASRIGRWAGPITAIAAHLLLWRYAGDLSAEGRATAALAVWMGVWWMTEALPLAATALLPIVVFPLAGVLPIGEAAAQYANPYIFLFLGGFLIALAMERWNLHRRIALGTLSVVGAAPRNLVGGFMLATAFLSMWISNTASTVMMLPIGASVITLARSRYGDEESPREITGLATCLMLGIAYSASIGGLATLVGTPTNAVLAGFVSENYGVQIGFLRWMMLGLPLAVIFLFIAWMFLTRVLFPIQLGELPGGRALMRSELQKLGPLSRGERIVLTVFLGAAAAWICREPLQNWEALAARVPPLARVHDTTIALAAALVLFATPVDWRRGEFVLDWPTAKKLPWDVLLLFGGGLSLAAGFEASKLSEWIGQQVAQAGALPPLAFITLITAVVILLTEMTSNTATASAFYPVLGGIAVGLEIDPLLLLVPGCLAASCAFMLPVATPPNAIVFGSGYLTIGQMAKAGVWLNLIGLVLIVALMKTLGVWVFGL
ncbi:MAG: SLC13 family permease [Planctomycetes bacterium]|nr:SLC13 family permease [Planctomycetota bacterium]